MSNSPGAVVAKPISRFFSDLGMPLNNMRWSWGARSGSLLLLRTWADEFKKEGDVRRVTVLRSASGYRNADSYGLDERYRHLEALWAGDVAGYTVMATVVDPKARPREIKEYRDEGVFSIESLEMLADGSLAAVLGAFVPLKDLAVHAQSHRTAAGAGPFPADPAMNTGVSTNAFQLKIPAMRAWFEEVCRARSTITYGELMDRFGLTFFPMTSALGRLGHDCLREGEPVITAIVVDAKTRRCSDGILKEFGVEDDEAERQRCYAYWSAAGTAMLGTSLTPSAVAPAPDTTLAPVDDLEQRAARFAQVEVRPQQAAFRNAVFRACGGRCVVSGCSVPEALEAAHLEGRAWRAGHNAAEDGILLRRDLHTLYDRGLLKISDQGVVAVDAAISSYYGEFDEVQAAAPAN